PRQARDAHSDRNAGHSGRSSPARVTSVLLGLRPRRVLLRESAPQRPTVLGNEKLYGHPLPAVNAGAVAVVRLTSADATVPRSALPQPADVLADDRCVELAAPVGVEALARYVPSRPEPAHPVDRRCDNAEHQDA